MCNITVKLNILLDFDPKILKPNHLNKNKITRSFILISISITTGNCTMFNNEFEQTSGVKPHIKIVAMIIQLKRCNGTDFSFTFKLGFNFLINKDSLIFRMKFDW